MKTWLSIVFAATVAFLLVASTAGYAQDCRALRWACVHKDELGLQGAGTCARYRELCSGQGRCAKLRWACEHKDELGLQGAGTCQRYREA